MLTPGDFRCRKIFEHAGFVLEKNEKIRGKLAAVD